jgi:hypothetical protein
MKYSLLVVQPAPNTQMHLLRRVPSWIILNWHTGGLVTCAVGIFAGVIWSLKKEDDGNQKTERKHETEVRALADKILKYASHVHKTYPTGDVVVSQDDLAAQLRKSPDKVVPALHLLLREQRAQKVPLNGYWKLNGESSATANKQAISR